MPDPFFKQAPGYIINEKCDSFKCIIHSKNIWEGMSDTINARNGHISLDAKNQRITLSIDQADLSNLNEAKTAYEQFRINVCFLREENILTLREQESIIDKTKRYLDKMHNFDVSTRKTHFSSSASSHSSGGFAH